jgi:hypothetical protein
MKWFRTFDWIKNAPERRRKVRVKSTESTDTWALYDFLADRLMPAAQPPDQYWGMIYSIERLRFPA